MLREDDDPWATRELAYPLVMPLAAALLQARYALRWTGPPLPATGPVLVVANHVHRLDAVVFATVASRSGRWLRFLALADLWEVRGLGWLLRHGRMIPVHRGQGPVRMARDAQQALDAGQAVLVYPEGQLPSADAEPPARAGAGLLALSAGVPVVPMAVWGLGRTRARRRRLRRPVGVAVGGPIDLSAWQGRTDERASQEAADALLVAVRRLLPRAVEAGRR